MTSAPTPTLLRRCQRTLAAATLLLAAAPAAMAWNAGTHRLAASIAWTVLDGPQREQVWALLQAHPDFPGWRSPRLGVAPGGASTGDRQAVFAEASVWADSIRDDADFELSGSAPVPAGFPDRLRHRDWHYVNQPLGEPAGGVLRGRLHEAIPLLHGWLSDPGSPYRAYALVWLLHLVADLHQPLHVSTRRLVGGGDDAGGNQVLVEIDATLIGLADRRQPLKLHRYWDDLVAPSWLSGKALSRLRERLLKEYARDREPIDFDAWRAQSFALAAGAYRGLNPDGRRVRIDAAEHRENQRVGERQVVRAGYRIAQLIGAALAIADRSAETGTGAQRVAGEKVLGR